jgi:hypothetical protein
MGTLYVANTTNQTREYCFRLPENPKIISIRVPPRTQKDLWTGSTAQLEAIIQEIERGHGAIPVNEVPRHRDFIGSCWSLDKPIPIGSLRAALDQNDNVLLMRGYNLRKDAAVAMNDHLHRHTPGYQGHVEMEVIEQQRPGFQPEIEKERIESLDEGKQPRGPGGQPIEPARRGRRRRAA